MSSPFAVLYRSFTGGIPTRRHLVREVNAFPRSLCQDVAWNVKATDSDERPWCMTCRGLAALELVKTARVLGFTGVAIADPIFQALADQQAADVEAGEAPPVPVGGRL